MSKIPRYYGIKKRYPRLPGDKWKAYLQMIRPFTVFAAGLAGIFLGITFTLLSGGTFGDGKVILLGLTLGLLQAGGQCFNLSYPKEIEIDKINKPYRPTVTGLVTTKSGFILSFILFGIGNSTAFLLGLEAGIVSLVITLFAIFYTASPIRAKERFMVGNIYQGIARGLLPPIFASMIFGFYEFAIVYGIAIALWITGFQSTKDFDDIEGDRQFGIKTLPVVLGRRGTISAMMVMLIASSVPLYLGFALGIIPNEPIWFLIFAPLIISIKILTTLKKDVKMVRMENSLSWVYFYLTLMFWFLIPMAIVGTKYVNSVL